MRWVRDFYRPQTKFVKVMFLQVSVCPHQGGMRGFTQGACMVLFRGGVCGFIWGAWMVFLGGHAWFFWGGMCDFFGEGAHGFFSFFGYNEIRSMSGWYTSYWNAFLFWDEFEMGGEFGIRKWARGGGPEMSRWIWAFTHLVISQSDNFQFSKNRIKC